MKYIEFDKDRYEAETDINGHPNRLGRYNDNHGIHISLLFSDTENAALLEEFRNGLKNVFISKMKSLTGMK